MTDKLETWENVTEGVVWVLGSDHRGAERAIKIVGGAKVQLKSEDREAIQLARPGVNPFESGRLRRVDAGAEPEQANAALSDDDLKEVLASDEDFLVEWLAEETELNVRRLQALQKKTKSGTLASSQLIAEAVRNRFPNMDYTDEQKSVMAENRD